MVKTKPCSWTGVEVTDYYFLGPSTTDYYFSEAGRPDHFTLPDHFDPPPLTASPGIFIGTPLVKAKRCIEKILWGMGVGGGGGWGVGR